jgi:hypothetical protein
MPTKKRTKPGELLIAFPKSETELRLVFSEPVDRKTAEDPSHYSTRSGLRILAAHVDPHYPQRVNLTTEPMNGESMSVDILRAPGVRTRTNQLLAHAESPEFIQGLASIPEIQKPSQEAQPFASRFVGKVASASCGKDGGVDSNVLINTFGFAFIHMESGGPFNSLKIVTKSQIPGIAQATRALTAGQTVHVLWAGGEIRNVNGENQLVDTGFMEGSIIPPNPLRSPRPFPVSANEIAGEASRSLRAKGLQGVVVRFEDLTIDEVSKPDKTGLRAFRFRDASGGDVSGVLLGNVTTALRAGQKLSALRALLHCSSAGHYEAIVELDQHVSLAATELFGHVTLVEGYVLPGFNGCHALVYLRDVPNTTVAVLTPEHRLQTLLETALETGNLIAFWGTLLSNPPTPRGGSWAVDVYQIDGVILYNRP